MFEAVMLILIMWSTYIRSRDMENRNLLNYLLNDGFIYILVSFLVVLGTWLVNNFIIV